MPSNATTGAPLKVLAQAAFHVYDTTAPLFQPREGSLAVLADKTLSDVKVRMQVHRMSVPADKPTFVAAIRGSYYLENWLANAQAKLVPADERIVPTQGADPLPMVHLAWQKIALRLSTMLEAELKDAHDARLYCVGHSLGGALSVLLALAWQQIAPSCEVHAMTWGAPMVGNDAFNEVCKGSFASDDGVLRAVHFVNSFDVVPKVPSKVLGFSPWADAQVKIDTAESRSLLGPAAAAPAFIRQFLSGRKKAGMVKAGDITTNLLARMHGCDLYFHLTLCHLGERSTTQMVHSSEQAGIANVANAIRAAGFVYECIPLQSEAVEATRSANWTAVQHRMQNVALSLKNIAGTGLVSAVGTGLPLVSAVGTVLELYGLYTVKREVNALREEVNEGLQQLQSSLRQLQTSLRQLDEKVGEGVEQICTEMKDLKLSLSENRIRDLHDELLGTLNGLRHLTSRSTGGGWESHTTAFLNSSMTLLEHINSSLLPKQHSMLRRSCFTLVTAHVIALDWLLKMERNAECSSLLGATVDLCELVGKLVAQQAFVLVLERDGSLDDYLLRSVVAVRQAFALAISEANERDQHNLLALMRFLEKPSRESRVAVQLQAAALQPFDPRIKLMAATAMLKDGGSLSLSPTNCASVPALTAVSALSGLTGAEAKLALELLLEVERWGADFASWAEAFAEWLEGLDGIDDSSLAVLACQVLGRFAVLPSLGEQVYLRIQTCARLTLEAFAAQRDARSAAQLVLASVGRSRDRPQLPAQGVADAFEVDAARLPPVILNLPCRDASRAFNIVIVGPPGAGKSTLAGLLFAKDLVLRSNPSTARVRKFSGSFFGPCGWATVNAFVVPWDHHQPRPSRNFLRVGCNEAGVEQPDVKVDRLVFVLATRLDEAVRDDIEKRRWLDGPQRKILLVLNKVEDEHAMHDKLTAQFRASLDLQEVEALCLRSFVRGEGPTRRDFVELTAAMLAGVDGRRST